MNSNASIDTQRTSSVDIARWMVVVLLVLAAVVGNAFFDEQPLLYRVLGVVGISSIALLVASQTVKGRAFTALLKESRAEVRRVVWPTKQETAQTTGIVVLVVFLMSLLLWALDSFFGWAISSVIG